MSAPDPRGARLATVEEAVAEFRRGRFVIVVDDEDRENEGDLVIAAEKVTPEAINFMATHARGLICIALTEQRCEELQLPPMVEHNTSPHQTAFCVSVEARHRTTTGISAADRANTVLTIIDPATRPHDLVRPGHMFPLRARPGGVLQRTGHTEASIDLARLSGVYPAAVICEIMDADGSMARLPRLLELAARHGFKVLAVKDLIAHRLRTERLVERVAAPLLPTRFGTFRAVAYRSSLTGDEHVALVMGDIDPEVPVLVRVHSQCLTGDVFGSSRCDCGLQLETAMKRIAAEGRGVLLYLLQEGRGIGLANKLCAYELQDAGADTVEANQRLGFLPDQRDYGLGAQILRELGVRRMRLMTNNPAKYVALGGYGLEIVERVQLEVPPTEHTRRYLEVKKRKMGHLLKMV
ncbi:MAG TPA: bifunctional 3,4-dihydroxy-2-butanone-4-phosphate synthase/GTP cyclohydrolase II [Thermoanaerobaculaceae bacterium]|nr:bifunctional 3,4-dihydroxy-2-butanone-4-phosphate synthase/GTP cyclohydrolase II [Thermoanaerobaculaceae bacterium]HRS16543.1 bifunctional 3,4-dihydroxy-2-butanone-4-phosphate synthase/GTP cyclohydrolase II [Thermoanaerobaculaceae bacterium]